MDAANESITGIATSTISYEDPFILFFAGALMLLGLGNFMLSIVYGVQKEDSDAR